MPLFSCAVEPATSRKLQPSTSGMIDGRPDRGNGIRPLHIQSVVEAGGEELSRKNRWRPLSAGRATSTPGAWSGAWWEAVLHWQAGV